MAGLVFGQTQENFALSLLKQNVWGFYGWLIVNCRFIFL